MARIKRRITRQGIADEFGYPFGTVTTWAIRHGWKPINPNSKPLEYWFDDIKDHVPPSDKRLLLTDAKVREIRKRVKAGESKRALGDEYGVHESYIGKLATREARPNV